MANDWRKGFKIVWHGDVPEGVEDRVRADMLESLTGLKKPSDLVFHTVFLGQDVDGPSVEVWGSHRDHRFHAKYAEKTEWVSPSPEPETSE